VAPDAYDVSPNTQLTTTPSSEAKGRSPDEGIIESEMRGGAPEED
jgi:hypothetical protein